jgi:hypothetical protein
MLPERPPSYAQSHDPQTLKLPSVPDLSPDHDHTLPPLASLPIDNKVRPETLEPRIQPWPSSNPLAAYYQPSFQTSPSSRATMTTDSPGAMDIDASTPDSHGRRGGSVLSIDDPDVRLAAEALGDLRAGTWAVMVQEALLTPISRFYYLSTAFEHEAAHPFAVFYKPTARASTVAAHYLPSYPR